MKYIDYSDKSALSKKVNEIFAGCVKEFQQKCKGLNSLKEQMTGNLESMLFKEKKFVFLEVESMMHIQEMKKVKKKEEELQQRIKDLTESGNYVDRSVKRQVSSSTFYSEAKRKAIAWLSKPVLFAKTRCSII